MKKIFEAVSGMILPGIAFAAIAAILTGSALLSKMGKRMDVNAENFLNYADTSAVAGICQREAPEIIFTGKKVWSAGEPIPIGDVFLAADAEGSHIPVEVEDITNKDGDSVMENYQEAGNKAVFQDRGVYTFHVSALDNERKTGRKKISIVVDGR